jgi:RHS repeat-associated protein
VKDEYDYDAFGIRSTTSQTSNSHGHYGYTGQEYDAEAGLLYLRARYYDPHMGRFISADPFLGICNDPALSAQVRPLMHMR